MLNRSHSQISQIKRPFMCWNLLMSCNYISAIPRTGSNIATGEEVAIKLECVKTKHPQLHIESKFYKMMQGGGKTHKKCFRDFGSFTRGHWEAVNSLRGAKGCLGLRRGMSNDYSYLEGIAVYLETLKDISGHLGACKVHSGSFWDTERHLWLKLRSI